jgi:cellulose synthase/poly-beta-1,6-N-acetylglucosamine synthase-like glycosyltransferase
MKDVLSLLLSNIYTIVYMYSLLLILYLALVSMFGIYYKSKLPKTISKHNKYTLVICAQNEQEVIESTIKNIDRVNYPKDSLEVVIVVDNSTDNTELLVSRAKLENFGLSYLVRNSDKVGKNYAIQFALDSILSQSVEEGRYIAFMDADNVINPEFFINIDDSIAQGYDVIQGNIKVKNINDTWLTNTIDYTSRITARAYFLARTNLGISVVLGGNAFVVKSRVFVDVLWSTVSITEDLEYTIQLIAKDYKIAYNHQAITYDEKPQHARASIRQRERWMKGHFWLLKNYFWVLFQRLLVSGNKLDVLDLMVYLLTPSKTVLLTLLLILVYIGQYLKVDSQLNVVLNANILSLILFFVVFNIVQDVVYAFLEGKKVVPIIKALFYNNVHSFDWFIATNTGLINMNKQTWGNSKTSHDRNITLEEIINK